ncbi:Cyclic nucleotide-binding domain [Phytophthora infestans]|uniref:Cyclic nucleotide-binding domain n=1 Tax=Phytophthora infestans TaxID=4787 RepID=A0A833WI28_PHYIN|nr:Cyclic nucleotide-binding domain [Phytophthora infestans]KAF4132431.1 Cyclic nucleotide-binding domain [Phytophthora infestans]
MDLYIQAHTGFYSDGNLIRDKKLTRHFVVIYPKLVAKLLLLKLLRWSRIPQFVSSLDEFYAKYFVVLKLLKVLAFTVFLAHVQACIRFNFHHYKIIEESVAHSHALHSQYLASMFWSFGIMTGLFEGELPHHSIEFLFTILVALCGFSMFTTLCATIFVISKCESGQTEAMEARINQLVHVLSFHRVPEDQQTQAIEYLKRYYTDTESHDRETCKLLCPSIANDIQVELWKATIADISIFEGCTDQFIVAMTSLLEMVAFPAQATLFSTGDHGDAMYVVHSGVFAIVINSVMVREIRKGSCFGELSVFSTMPRTATVISTTYVILYKLSRFHCERVLQGYPECASLIHRHVHLLLSQLSQSASNHASSSSSSSIKSAGIRRASVASAFVKVLSKRGRTAAVFTSRRSILSWLGRRSSVTPESVDQGDPSGAGNEDMFLSRKSKIRR